jgi:hypothetical protein
LVFVGTKFNETGVALLGVTVLGETSTVSSVVLEVHNVRLS